MNYKLPYKVFFLLFAGLLLMSPGTFAQDTTEGVYDDPLRFGAKIGFTSSAFAIDYENITDSKKGITVGGFVSYKFFDWLRVQGEVAYQMQGASNIERESTNPNESTFSNIIAHNIEVPVTAQLSPPGFDGGSFEPYLSLGMAYGYNMQTYSVNKTIFTSEDGTEYGGSSWSNVSEFYQVNDLGALIGFGLNMKTESLMYTLEARYRMGLTNINNTNSTNSLDYLTSNVGIVSLQIAF